MPREYDARTFRPTEPGAGTPDPAFAFELARTTEGRWVTRLFIRTEDDRVEFTLQELDNFIRKLQDARTEHYIHCPTESKES